MNSNERKELYKLIKNLALFSAPCTFLVALTVLIDPFCISEYIPLPVKKESIAVACNERLWKLNQFTKKPTTHVLIGDSRAQRIYPNELISSTKKPWSSIALSGASLVELCDIFWFVAKETTLQEVMLCVNFDRFNDWQTASGVHQAKHLIEHRLSYYFNPETIKATLKLCMQLFFSTYAQHQNPPVNREQFWEEQLQDGKARYQKYIAPHYAQKELEQISNYCREHSIHLTFVTLPTHVSFQNLVKEAHLEKEEQQFKTLLAQLGSVIDLDIPNDFTHNVKNFSDPWHVAWKQNKKIVELVVKSNFKV